RVVRMSRVISRLVMVVALLGAACGPTPQSAPTAPPAVSPTEASKPAATAPAVAPTSASGAPTTPAVPVPTAPGVPTSAAAPVAILRSSELGGAPKILH